MAPKNVIEHKNSDIPRIKIVINWASHNDDLNEQSVLIGPKFKHEFQIPAASWHDILESEALQVYHILLKNDLWERM